MIKIKMVDKRTGSYFWVAEERKNEYLAAGHKLAATPSAPKVKEVVEEAKEEAVEETVEEKAEEIVEEQPKPSRPRNRSKKR